MADYIILSPYIIPPGTHKARNVGDGLIAMRLEDMLKPHRCVALLSSRATPTGDELSQLNEADFVVLGGANQLHDEWEVVPGGVPIINKISVPIIPIGVGIDGRPERSRELTATTKAALSAIHERIPASSWRCPNTTAYLSRQVPELADKLIMTGCPVAHGDALLRGDPFPDRMDTIVVTVTDREDFWRRESETLRVIAKLFPRSTRVVALHQDFAALTRSDRRSVYRRILRRHTSEQLRDLARALGFDIRVLVSTDDATSTYSTCDLHIGSRVHAHLFSLSLARRSVVTMADDRVVGLARAYGFPIAPVYDIVQYIDRPGVYERHRVRAQELNAVLLRFIDNTIGACA